MDIEFDSFKNQVNIAKHGVSLGLASQLDWESALVWVDERYAYGELRMIALVPDPPVLFYVAFVDRGDLRRIISLRRANHRETNHYVNTI
jgi:uncharacterized DUF497 family protein